MLATLFSILVVAVIAIFVYRKHKAKMDPTLDKAAAEFDKVKDKINEKFGS